MEEQDYQLDLEGERAAYQKSQREAQTGEANQTDQERMGWGFFLFLLFVCVILDVIDFFTLGTVGWLIGIFGDLFLAAVMGMSKGGRKQFKKLLIGLAGESLPIVAILPLRTIMLIWAFVSSRPELMSKIQKGLAVASKIPSPISAELKVASKVVNVAAAVAQRNQQVE